MIYNPPADGGWAASPDDIRGLIPIHVDEPDRSDKALGLFNP